MISIYILSVVGYPRQLEDTPIQKITIRPTKHRHPRPKTSSYPTHAIVVDRFGKSHKKAMMQEKLTGSDSPSNVITIIKEKPQIRILGFGYKRKAKGPVNLNGTHPIFFAEARVNGSFRDQPIRNISGERIWESISITIPVPLIICNSMNKMPISREFFEPWIISDK